MVYIDNMEHPFGRMKMCHMIADTSEELFAMAEKIGVPKKWVQYPGTYREHFDVSLTKKALAIKHGATAITMKELGERLALRPGSPFYKQPTTNEQ